MRPLPGSTRMWLVAPALPVAATAASLFVHVDPGVWFSMPPAMRRAATADALLYIAGAAIIAAPVAGVAVAAWQRGSPWRRSAWRAAGFLCAAVGAFVAASALLTALGLGLDRPGTAAFIATSHTTLAAVALALAAFGAFCGVMLRDPLDAVACSLTVVMVATVGLLVAGASVADAPRQLIDVALTASPLVAIASAAQIDVVRTGVLYQISPLAHVQVDYPSWYAAAGWYLAVAGVCFLGFTWKFRALPTTRVS